MTILKTSMTYSFDLHQKNIIYHGARGDIAKHMTHPSPLLDMAQRIKDLEQALTNANLPLPTYR